MYTHIVFLVCILFEPTYIKGSQSIKNAKDTCRKSWSVFLQVSLAQQLNAPVIKNKTYIAENKAATINNETTTCFHARYGIIA